MNTMLITEPTEIDGRLWLPGEGVKPARVMFIAPCIAPEEVVTEKKLPADKKGMERTQKVMPRMLYSPQGMYFKECALKSTIRLDQEAYFTTIIKYLPENVSHRTKPLKSMIQEAWPYLEAEIEAVKPEVIACVGKLVFDQFVPFRAKESDVRGGWFYSERYDAKLFLIPHIAQVLKADKHEAFTLAFDALRQMLDETSGVKIEKVPIRGRVIKDSKELEAWVEEMIAEEVRIFSVDCEWHGHQHVDGYLRSLQIAWTESDAIYIRFRDEEGRYVFDVGYKEAGAILSRVLDHEDSYYIGHHLSVDLTWMHYWLGLQWYKKGIFDTEFGEQCTNEALGLGLDDLALRYTDFGKYDWDLIWWKKEHPEKCVDGYGFIPDRILIPYGWKDVLTVYRAWPKIKKKLEDQELMRYYSEIVNPNVCDIFTFYCLKGLPIDREKIDEMRDLYNWAKRELMIDFQRAITKEADAILRERLQKMDAEGVYDAVEELLLTGRIVEAEEELKRTVGAARWPEMMPIWDHAVNAPNFNDRSKPQMMRWLFQVKEYEPIKSTPNREKGMPSISWEKVKTFPPDVQLQYTPATDVQTLEILAAKYNDETIRQLLMLNAVGNICKSFLKPAEKDEEGNLIKEEGLHFWIASDDAIHYNSSLTETGRSRVWAPNAVNWPSYIGVKLGTAITEIIKRRNAARQLPIRWSKYVRTLGKDFPTVRSICMARPGWCIVEADYQTAEMRGLAFISGDEKLKKLILEPDDCFALPDPKYIPEGISPEDCTIRLKFPDYITHPKDKEKYILSYATDGKIHCTFTPEQLLRDEKGEVVHTGYDMHWGLAEMSRHTCREEMNKKKDRGAAKITGFSSSYGGTASSIARKIESDTGEKVTEEEAQDLLNAIEKRQPRATEFFREMENYPLEGKPFLQAASGRKRHLQVLGRLGKDIWNPARMNAITALGRECRNYLMQESVAATSALAGVRILDFIMQNPEVRGYPIVCLYDSLVIHCPEEEREIWKKALELYMHTRNGWWYEGDILRYPIDTEVNAGWSTKAVGRKYEELHDPEYKPTPEGLKEVERWLDFQITTFNEFPELSVYNVWDMKKKKEL